MIRILLWQLYKVINWVYKQAMQLYIFIILTIAKLFTLSTKNYLDGDTHFRTSRKCHETTINFWNCFGYILITSNRIRSLWFLICLLDFVEIFQKWKNRANFFLCIFGVFYMFCHAFAVALFTVVKLYATSLTFVKQYSNMRK